MRVMGTELAPVPRPPPRPRAGGAEDLCLYSSIVRRFLLAFLTAWNEPFDFEEPVEIRRLEGVATWEWPV